MQLVNIQLDSIQMVSAFFLKILENFTFLVIFTYGMWKIDKDIQKNSTSQEIFNITGLSIIFGLPFTILSYYLTEFVPATVLNINSSLLIHFIPVIIMIAVLAYHLGYYTKQSSLGIVYESLIVGAIISVILRILFLTISGLIFLANVFS